MPAPPAAVAAAYAAYPAPARHRLLELRELVLSVADGLELELEETLKWGEPAYLPRRPRTGTTVRLHASPKRPGTVGLYVSCQTSLVATFAERHPQLVTEGKRAVLLDVTSSLPDDALRDCVALALTYKLRR